MATAKKSAGNYGEIIIMGSDKICRRWRITWGPRRCTGRKVRALGWLDIQLAAHTFRPSSFELSSRNVSSSFTMTCQLERMRSSFSVFLHLSCTKFLLGPKFLKIRYFWSYLRCSPPRHWIICSASFLCLLSLFFLYSFFTGAHSFKNST